MDSTLFTATVLANWETAINRATVFFDKCSDADLLKPIAPGKNRVIYLLGHLTAVSDRMLP
ncbi:MAG TPA: DinB family protein, partial [Puia sp.]|nr:DinB family protein [Puia sp.]